MADKNILGMPQNRGIFQLSGLVTGVDRDSFYSEGTGKTGRPWRRIQFGVEIESGKTVYVQCFGTVQDSVYFSKTVDKKTETRAISWANRFDDMGDFQLIGVNTGCSKVIDPKTKKEVNDRKRLTPYDACEEMKKLADGDSVFIRGNISYSEYNGRHQTSFEITQVSLTSKPIDFEAENFKPLANFTQNIVVMGINKSEDGEEFIMNADIVGYNSIEHAEFYLKNPKLAKNIKNLKSYVGLKVFGDIVVESNYEEVEDSDDWGLPNAMERVVSPYVRKLLVTGADKDSIDRETFTEANFDKAISIINSSKRSSNEYGKKDDDDGDDWGEIREEDLPDGW